MPSEVRKVRRIAVISAILENPSKTQQRFNEMVSASQDIIRGRMGIPFDDHNIAVVSLTLVGTNDQINSLTGKLGGLPGVQVKASISRKEIE
jgi:putative iron-only hydrogenase system regulator